MAMFQWGGCFYINPEDVAAISTGSDGSNTHAHYMTVHLRTGKEFRVNYGTASARNADAQRLAQAVNKARPDPVSRYEMENMIDRAKESIRRDVKALRRDITAERERVNPNKEASYDP